MTTQLTIFLLSFGALQGMLLLLVMVGRKHYRPGYLLLSFYIAVMVLQLTLKLVSKSWLMDHVGLVYALGQYLPLLYGPLAWLFVRSLLTGERPGKHQLLHLLPFVSALILLVFDDTGWPGSEIEIIYNPQVRLVLVSTSVTVYHCMAWMNWLRYRSIHTTAASLPREIFCIKNFILLSMLVSLVIALALYFLYINYPLGHEYRFGFVALSIFIYWITHAAMKRSFEIDVAFIKTPSAIQTYPTLVIHRPAIKYASSTLQQQEKSRICAALEEQVKTGKVYLDAALTIEVLANQVPCTKHALSQVLNECMNQSFYDYINYHRVQEACVLLADEDRKTHTIASIAYDAGFNSISTFNEVFKKVSGCTPSQYRKFPRITASQERV